VTGLLKTLKRQASVFAHGLIILVALIFAQILLGMFQIPFFMYNPPIGFAFFLVASYLIQPMLLGALNVILVYKLYNTEGRMREFWIHGLFLFLIFSTVNMLLQTILNLSFTASFAIVETVLLAYPFGLLGRLSNT
jgi:putative effector of murein hydrolase